MESYKMVFLSLLVPIIPILLGVFIVKLGKRRMYLPDNTIVEYTPKNLKIIARVIGVFGFCLGGIAPLFGGSILFLGGQPETIANLVVNSDIGTELLTIDDEADGSYVDSNAVLFEDNFEDIGFWEEVDTPWESVQYADNNLYIFGNKLSDEIKLFPYGAPNQSNTSVEADIQFLNGNGSYGLVCNATNSNNYAFGIVMYDGENTFFTVGEKVNGNFVTLSSTTTEEPLDMSATHKLELLCTNNEIVFSVDGIAMNSPSIISTNHGVDGILLYDSQNLEVSLENFKIIWHGSLKGTPAELSNSDETYTALSAAKVPARDDITFSEQMGITGYPNIERAVINYEVGEQGTFFVTDMSNGRRVLVTATLKYKSDVFYIWVDQDDSGQDYDYSIIGEQFSNEIYPKNINIFGSENNPGLDNDPHVYALYSSKIGNVGGYFSLMDTLPTYIAKTSNEREMFLINSNMDKTRSLSTLSHEFQHMILNNINPGESAWMNEGYSELASYLNGFTMSSQYGYLQDTGSIQLNNWSGSGGAHYGASYLFTRYVFERFGEEPFLNMYTNPNGGLNAIDDMLQFYGFSDDGKIITGDDVFMDWVNALWLSQPENSNWKYSFRLPDGELVRPNTAELLCSEMPLTDSTKQYAVQYYDVSNCDSGTVTFTGETSIRVIPMQPRSGSYYAWSNRGDVVNSSLTYQFDLTDVSGQAEMTYNVSYDIEQDYDFVYVMVSEDGNSWTSVKTNDMSREHTYGSGYTGDSLGWISQNIDLTDYVGKQVYVRFSYITDSAISQNGLVIDDIEIKAIGFYCSFEDDFCGASPEGFVRMNNQITPKYGVSIITEDGAVNEFVITGDQEVEFHLNDGDILTVSGLTRWTTTMSSYTLNWIEDEINEQ